MADDRFAAIRARLKGTEEKTEKASGFSRVRRTKTSEEVEVDPLYNSEVYKILTDAQLEPAQKVEKLAELLTFDETDPEKSAERLNANRDLVSELLRDFTEHNRESIALVRDNPLSKLRASVKEVFEEYGQLVDNRSDLKDKLEIIDELIQDKGGPEGLINDMLKARVKSQEKDALDAQMQEATKLLEATQATQKEREARKLALKASIDATAGDPFLFLKGGKRRFLRERREETVSVDTTLAQLEATSQEQAKDVQEAAGKFEAFISSEDWRLNEKILEILDIGDEEFIERVKLLSDLTLRYIDGTEETLEGVRAQLEELLNRVNTVHNLTQNTNESVTIILDAQQKAQTANAKSLKEMDKRGEMSGLDKLNHEKTVRALNQHVSGLEKTIQSTAAVAGELGKVEASLTNFKDQMEEGLADAVEQQMLAVGTAAVSGNNTLMRIEGLATFVQSMIAKGQYARESEEALGDLAKEMERALMGRMAKNASINDMGNVLKEMTDAMDEKNDVVLEIAEERKELIDRLIMQSQELSRANEEALGIEAEVNRRLYTEE